MLPSDHGVTEHWTLKDSGTIFMFTKFRIGESAVCHCDTSPMTVEHFLQNFSRSPESEAETWPADTPVMETIYGPVENVSILYYPFREIRAAFHG